ncbi:Hsp20/alpha crystallin family protein [Halalkalibacter alkaliphilus]|uniref:Hsp20/alpha crystallin family protein n=1 Tax=Halalkalibacter alkaliphilus TaxID=2917993 RepID=A0A9X2CUH2_9BACI|nr:Hsp20/alpha crystallin family protein [Halalkalibacter alkaliphilus]MCL7748456.1 Hsp20/alpha crystallin family protein [Halalkalibacter alkaliphilus]
MDFKEWNNPFQNQFQGEFWNNFNNLFNGAHSQPRVNLYQSGHELICNVFLPGIKRVGDIHLSVNGSTLEVSGSTSLEYNGFQIIQQEFPHGSYKRIVELPFSVRKDKIDASYKSGLLTVRLYRLIPVNEKEKLGIPIRDEE